MTVVYDPPGHVPRTAPNMLFGTTVFHRFPSKDVFQDDVRLQALLWNYLKILNSENEMD
jgi:hypothetical protein